MTTDSPFRISHSCASDARQAAREFHAGVVQPDMSMVVFFCSSDYDLDALADELNQLFGSVPVVGCTTAGEIGSAGYRAQSLSGVSFSSRAGAAVAGAAAHAIMTNFRKRHDIGEQSGENAEKAEKDSEDRHNGSSDHKS